MKKLIAIFVICWSILMTVHSQGLDAEWQTINTLYSQEKYDSVLIRIPNFIENLKTLNQPKNLFVAYLCYGFSGIMAGRYHEADSVQSLIAGLAYTNDLLPIYRQTMNEWSVQFYKLAKAAEHNSSEISLQLYERASSLADTIRSAKLHIYIALDLSELYVHLGQAHKALSVLEAASAFISPADTSMAKVNKLLTSRLAKLSATLGIADTAAQKKQISQSGRDIEEIVHDALEAEKKFDYRLADTLLSSIEAEYVRNKGITSIVEFFKKRFELRMKLGETREGLQILLNGLKEIPTDNDSAKFAGFQLKCYLISLRNYYYSDSNSKSGLALTDSLLNSLKQEIFVLDLPRVWVYRYYLLDANSRFLSGDYIAAETSYQQALAGSDLLTKNEQLDLLNNFGLTEGKNNKGDEGIRHLTALKELSLSLKNDEYLLQAYLNLGVLFIRKGDYQEALLNLKAGRALAHDKKNTRMEVLMALHCADVYTLTGYDKIAADMYTEVKHTYSGVPDALSKITILQSLAEYERKSGNGESSLRFLNEALALAGKNNFSSSLITIAMSLGDVNLAVDSVLSAIGYYKIARSSMRSAPESDENIMAMLKISRCWLLLSQFDSAKTYLDRVALILTGQDMTQLLNSGKVNWTATYHISLACALYAELQYFQGINTDDHKMLVSAFESARESIKLLDENSLMNLQGKGEKVESVKLDAYRILIDIAYTLYERTKEGQYFEALYDASEQSRARNFVKEVGTQLIAKLNNPQAKQISTLAEIAGPLKEKSELSYAERPVMRSGSRAATRSGLSVVRDTSGTAVDAQDKYDALLKELKNQDSRVGNLVAPNIISIPGLISLLRPTDAIINYVCSYNQLYLIYIAHDAQKIIKLETALPEIESLIADYDRSLQNTSTREFEELSASLYHILLAPISADITGKRLYIVPSGKLHNLPFSSLRTGRKFFIENNQLCILPNASSFQMILRNETPNKELSMLAVGNPANPAVVELMGAENEVEVIKDIFPGTQVLLRENASETVIKQFMNNFDIVHFACHGIFNYEYPLLSALMLAPSGTDDGRLELHEIYNLNLMRTKLVVLSACQTGLAQIKKNDDMTGLVRGFLYAGVPSVIASLWQVDDQSTFILMTRFYYYLHQGDSKADALRKAQIELIQSKDYGHPFYWSAFCLNGYGE